MTTRWRHAIVADGSQLVELKSERTRHWDGAPVRTLPKRAAVLGIGKQTAWCQAFELDQRLKEVELF